MRIPTASGQTVVLFFSHLILFSLLIVLAASSIDQAGASARRPSATPRRHGDVIQGTHLQFALSDLKDEIARVQDLKSYKNILLDPHGDDNGWEVAQQDADLPEMIWDGEGEVTEEILQAHLQRAFEVAKEINDTVTAQDPPLPKSSGKDDGTIRSLSALAADHVHAVFEEATHFYDPEDRADFLTDEAISTVHKFGEAAAFHIFEKVYQVSPQRHQAKMNLGVAYMRRGHFDEALNLLRQVLDEAPDHREAAKNYKECLELASTKKGEEMGTRLQQTLHKAQSWNSSLPSRPPGKLKRLTVDDLYKPENFQYLHGAKPFILQHAFNDSELDRMQRKLVAFLEYFSDKSVVSYHPFGSHDHVLDPSGHISLRRMLKLLDYTHGERTPGNEYIQNRTHSGIHGIWSPTWLEWDSLIRFLGINNRRLPPLFQDESHGLKTGAGFRKFEDKVRFEWGTRWKLMTIGGHRGGMNIHRDWLPVGSWQLQLLGAKTWFLCSNQETGYLGIRNDQFDAHSPDFQARPQLYLAKCMNSTVYPGEFIYYPSSYWHQTLYHIYPESGMDDASGKWGSPWHRTPLSVSISSTVQEAGKVEEVRNALNNQCEKGKRGEQTNILDGTDKFCGDYLGSYYDWLKARYEGLWESDLNEQGTVCNADELYSVYRALKRARSSYELIESVLEDLEETYQSCERHYELG
eukprot:gb/GECG01007416.1/.p1 GENE.gb/GECG01007416.1/~~gb/GECG01007416.1/.p1  ORF type:complete len:691 (+),score=92.41 gb/GECG01007416.1/:1-2073(+)